MYTIKSAPGKGLGVFANQDIPRGTRLTSERPLITAPREEGSIDPLPAFEAFENLTPKDQQTYLSLSNSQMQYDNAMACIDEDIDPELRSHVAKVASIFECNAFNIGDADEEGNVEAGIFPIAARFNHECCPNVSQTWNKNINSLTIHTVRHIQAGEELCDSYVPLCQSSAARKEELAAYGFNCLCSVCGQSQASIMKSDSNRQTIHRLGEDLEFFGLQSKGYVLGPISPSLVREGKNEPLNVVRYIEHLLEEEGLTGHDLAQYYSFATWYCSSQNLEGSLDWQQKLFDLSNIVKGPDHEDTISAKRRLAELTLSQKVIFED